MTLIVTVVAPEAHLPGQRRARRHRGVANSDAVAVGFLRRKMFDGRLPVAMHRLGRRGLLRLEGEAHTSAATRAKGEARLERCGCSRFDVITRGKKAELLGKRAVGFLDVRVPQRAGGVARREVRSGGEVTRPLGDVDRHQDFLIARLLLGPFAGEYDVRHWKRICDERDVARSRHGHGESHGEDRRRATHRRIRGSFGWRNGSAGSENSELGRQFVCSYRVQYIVLPRARGRLIGGAREARRRAESCSHFWGTASLVVPAVARGTLRTHPKKPSPVHATTRDHNCSETDRCRRESRNWTSRTRWSGAGT